MELNTPGIREVLRRNFEPYRKALHRYVMKRMGRSADFEDVSQEVYARLLKVDDSRLVEKPLAYIYGIANNVICDIQNEAGRLNSSTVPLDTLPESMLEEHPALQEDDSSDQLNLQQQVESALAGLSQNEADALLFTNRDGMTYEETARKLGLTLGQMRHHINSAYRHFGNRKWDR